MSNTELRFDHPWLLLLVLPAIALILLPYFRLPARRRKTVRQLVPTVLHCVMALLLTLVLAGTAFVRTTDNQAVVLLLDYSDSTLPVRDAIDQDAKKLQSVIRKNAPVGIVAFGGDCVYDAWSLTKPEPAVKDATDLSAALEYAASKLPDDKVGRIILLSDGKQTDGDANTTAQYLRSQGVRIDTVWFDSTTDKEEVQITDFVAPASGFAGNTLTFVAELECNTNSRATLTLLDGQTQVYTESMSLSRGTKVLPIEVADVSAGTHNYSLMLQASDDTIPENNQAFACVEVVEKPSVLIISGANTDAAPLHRALASYGEISVCTADKAPRKLPELCNYDGIFLLNVHADDLPKHYGSLLNSYVYDHGRSLVAIGGDDTFMYGAMRDNVYEEMMPVDFHLSRTSEDDSVALMLVIDCSLSMSQQSAYMSLAKQGAIKCVQSMTENDYVGIISFNQSAAVEAPLAVNTTSHKDSLNRIISGLTTSQGTYYTDALALAHQELLKSEAPIRHILFVSDGGPADTSYKDLIPQIAADGIAISTVALSYESTILSSMAENCGGSYYYIEQATDLPDIMLSLTQQVSVNSFMTGAFLPQKTGDTALSLPDSLPQLDGYLGTTLKKGADLHLTVGEGHPLYASWTWGKGTVACFTSGLDENWGSRWLADTTLLQAVLSHAMPAVHNDSALTLTAKPGGNSILLTVQTPDTDDARLTVTCGDKTTYLTCISPGTYSGSVSTASLGAYPVTITQYDKNDVEVDTLQTTLSVPVRTEYHAYGDNGQALLKSIALHGGGVLAESPEDLAHVSAEAISAVSDFKVPFGILFVLLLLTDVIIRKLRWKDIKNLWLTVIRRK